MDKKENIKNINTTLPFIKTSDKETMEISIKRNNIVSSRKVLEEL